MFWTPKFCESAPSIGCNAFKVGQFNFLQLSSAGYIQYLFAHRGAIVELTKLTTSKFKSDTIKCEINVNIFARSKISYILSLRYNCM